jgi:NADH:ubiquinone oxidoreductase subunit K
MTIAEGTFNSCILSVMMVWIWKWQVVRSVLAFLWILGIIARRKLVRITILTEIRNRLWRTMKNLHGVDSSVLSMSSLVLNLIVIIIEALGVP